MRSTRWILPFLVAALAACSPSEAPPSQTGGAGGAAGTSAGADDTPVVARVGGQDVTLAELDRWIKDELFREEVTSQDQASAYDLRREKLDELIDRRVLEAEAQRQGVTPEELLARQSRDVAVGDDEVKAFFDENEERLGGASYEQIAPRIRQHLEARQGRQAQADLLRSLRDAAGVQVLMQAPRMQVAAIGPSLGPESAPVTIVEFSDFQCPFCARAAPIVKEIHERYPEQVRIVYRNFPLDSIHPRARPAALAAACAGEQGKFWDYHDLLFRNNRALADEDLHRYAEEAGLDTKAFDQCYSEERYANKLSLDLQAGRQAGVSGTPTFFVNGRKLGGAKPVEDFVRLIDEELRRAGASSPASAPPAGG